MALQLYRRHRADCTGKRARHDRSYRRCHCPIYAEGTLRLDRFIRKATGETSWERAEEIKALWERNGTTKPISEPGAPAPEPQTIEAAVAAYFEDARARKVSEATLGKYHVLLRRQLLPYAVRLKLRYLKQLDLNTISAFRATWPDGAIAGKKKLERLRAFLGFAQDRGWIGQNPAAKLKPPKTEQAPTLPFTRQEMVEILAACDRYPDNYGRTGQPNAVRLRALTLMLRYSGLRIGDAVALKRGRLDQNKLLLYTQKTGVGVYVPLPPSVVHALNALPSTYKGKEALANEEYFFWTGQGRLKSAVADWQRAFRKLFRLAGLWKVSGKPNGHPHRFRDTFAVSLLENDTPIEEVSILLGHRSVTITEKHYAPWVRSRQRRLEEHVARAWAAEEIPEFPARPVVQ